MTTEQRLITVESDLEAVKTLLMSAARYAESANRGLDRLTERFDGLTVKVDQLFEAQTETQAQLTQLVESQVQGNARLDRIEQALEGLLSSQAAEREAREALRENSERAISKLTQDLTANVEDLVQMMSSLANDVAQDKAEIRRIWQYLLRQAGNGSQPS